jgi:phosphoglycolate phosphatase
LFDLDGTLLNTLDDLADSANRMLARMGFPTHPVEAYRYFVGDGVQTLIARIVPEAHQDPATLAACFKEYRREYGRHWKDKTRPYDGIPELLAALKARGLKLAVLSNKPHDSTAQCVTELLPVGAFDVIQGQREGIPHKPDPGGALAVARTLGIPCAEFLYLGDTATDMQTAVAAGMFPVGALWGFRSEDELKQSGARALAARPMDVLALLA